MLHDLHIYTAKKHGRTADSTPPETRQRYKGGCYPVFAWLAWQNPHMAFQEPEGPTNHLGIETIGALAEAINNFEGGMMLVSHDFRLIQQVAQEIWVCEKQTIKKWNGDILEYKEHLKTKIDKQAHDI